MEKTLIGHVMEVDGNRFRIRLLDSAAKLKGSDASNSEIGQIDSFIAIRQHNVTILASVLRTWSQAACDGSGCFLDCAPLGQVDDNNVFFRGIQSYPVPSAEVFDVTLNEIQSLFSNNRKYNYSFGHLQNYPDIRAFLNPNFLLGRHLAILGQSGSGKSWTVTSLIQQTIKTMPNAHIILLDLHGEYGWYDQNRKLRGAFDASVMRYIDARDLEIPYWLLTYSELIDLLIDRRDAGASTQIAYLRDVLKVLRRNANKHLEIDGLSVDSPVFFPLPELVMHFKKANELQTDFGKTKGPLFGQFDDFLVKLQSKLNDSRYDFLFKPKRRKNSESLESLLKDFVGLTEPRRQVTVIDLSPIPSDIRPIVAAQLGRLAFEFNYWNPHRDRFPLQLICEEAHAYIPRDDDPRYRGTRLAMERIAKEGRKYGVGLTVVSQRPHELSETVLSQCSNFLCMRLTNPDDQNYVRSLVPEGEDKLTQTLSSLGRGEGLILGEATPLPARVQIDIPSPPPNSQDADFFNHWRESQDEVDVANIVHMWRSQQR